MKTYAMKVTYYSTLYKRDVTQNVFGNIEFKGNEIVFASGGHRYAVDVKQVKKIEPLEDK